MENGLNAEFFEDALEPLFVIAIYVGDGAGKGNIIVGARGEEPTNFDSKYRSHFGLSSQFLQPATSRIPPRPPLTSVDR